MSIEPENKRLCDYCGRVCAENTASCSKCKFPAKELGSVEAFLAEGRNERMLWTNYTALEKTLLILALIISIIGVGLGRLSQSKELLILGGAIVALAVVFVWLLSLSKNRG